jgi:hypothetical protein
MLYPVLRIHVFGPPGSGSGSISQRHGSGSGSFYHHAKIVRKTLIPTVLWLLFDLSITSTNFFFSGAEIFSSQGK